MKYGWTWAVVMGLLTLAAAGWAQDTARSRKVDVPSKSLRVTLSVTDESLADVTYQLQRQAGLTIAFTLDRGDDLTRRISLNVKDKPLWDAVLAVSQALQQPEGRLEAAVTVAGSASAQYRLDGPVQVAGNFLVVAQSVSHYADFAGDPSQQDPCWLMLQAFPAPAIRFASHPRAVVPEIAVDEKGTSLVPAAAAGEEMVLPDISGQPVQVRVLLAPPAHAGHAIARIKGKIPIVQIVRTQTLSLKDLASGKTEATVQGIKITLSCRNSGAITSLELRCQSPRPGDSQPISPSVLIQAASLRLEDGDGHIFSNNGASWGGTTRTINYTQNAVGDGEGLQAVAEIPVELKTVEVPFEFRDLPLP